MRIYAVADIHGEARKIERIRNTIQTESPDLLVAAGDLTRFFSPGKTIDQLNRLPVPVLAIRGNSDAGRVERLLADGKNTSLLNKTAQKILGLEFLGLGGTLPLPFVSKVGLREATRFNAVKKKITSRTVLVVHPPPRGVCDRVGNRFHAGSFVLRHCIDTHPPLVVLCGHIHEQAGARMLGKTLIVNCAMNKKSNGAIIDYDRDMHLSVKMV